MKEEGGSGGYLGSINLNNLSMGDSTKREDFGDAVNGLVGEKGELNKVMDVLYDEVHTRQKQGGAEEENEDISSAYYVTLEDLAELMSIPLNDKSRGLLEQVSNILDTDGDGKIDLREFLENFALLLGDDVDQKLQLLFNVYDVDGDGSLTHEEVDKLLSESLKINGLALSPERKEILINAMFDMLDIDGDGEVSLDDFIEAMKSFSEPEKLGLAAGGRTAGEDYKDLEAHFLSAKAGAAYKIESGSSSDSSDDEGGDAAAKIRAERKRLQNAHDQIVASYSAKHKAFVVESGSSSESESSESDGARTKAFKAKKDKILSQGGGNMDAASTPLTPELKQELKAYTKVAANFGEARATAASKKRPGWQNTLIVAGQWSLKNWNLMLWTFILFWMNILAFLSLFIYYTFDSGKEGAFRFFSWGVSCAKGFAGIMLLNCALILMSVSRGFITQLRRTALTNVFPFDENLRFHKAFATLILCSATGHTLGHISNYVMVLEADDDGEWDDAVDENYWDRIPKWWEYLLFFPVPTGIAAWLSMIAIFCTAHERVRHRNFEAFWYTHHLFVLFYISLLIHGAGGILQFPVFWGCVLVPMCTYGFDRLLRVLRTWEKTKIVRVIQHPNAVIEVVIQRPKLFFYRAGHYIFLNVPGISRLQWHPFTMTSSPLEKEWISVHVRTLGNWTGALYKHFHSKEKPSKWNILFQAHRKRVNVDGPFGAPCEDILSYDVAVLVGAGIGVTPFASVCRTIQLMQKKGMLDETSTQRYIFIWLNSNMACFEWFAALLHDVILEVHPIVKLRTYMTRATNRFDLRSFMLWTALQAAYTKTGIDLLTGLPSQTHWGYPNWDELFLHIRDKYEGKKIGVFFCGAQGLANKLNWLCRQNSDKKTSFKF